MHTGAFLEILGGFILYERKGKERKEKEKALRPRGTRSLDDVPFPLRPSCGANTIVAARPRIRCVLW